MSFERGREILADLIDSGGDARSLSEQQIPILKAIFEDTSGAGLWYFARYVCGCMDITPHLHADICAFLSRWGRVYLDGGEVIERPPAEGEIVETSWRRLMLCIPRDCFKTTLGTRSMALWTATRNPEATIGIFNEAQDNSKKWIGAIKQVVEASFLYQTLWPEVLPPGIHWREREKGISVPRSWKWGDTGVLFQRQSMNVSELTFEPFGVGSAHTGKHFTHKIYDDIVGQGSTESEAEMAAANDFVDHGRAIERPSDNGCELVNFTRWAYADTYQHMLDKWPDDYQVYHRSLLEHPETGEPDVVSGTSIFPERFPTSLCKKMHADDPFTFASQRQCIPQAGRETSFDPDWIRTFFIEEAPNGEPSIRIPRDHYDPMAMDSVLLEEELPEPAPNVVPLHWCDISILFDPIPGKKSERAAEPRCRHGLVVVALDPWGRAFTLQSVPLRVDIENVLEAIIWMCVYWKTLKVGVEEVVFSAVLAPLWTRIMRHEHPDISLQFIPLTPKGRSKDTRIQAMIGPHKRGLWYYNEVGCEHVIQELIEYPHAGTRDLIDAQAYWDQALSRNATPQEVEMVQRYTYDADTQRDAYTGY